MRSIEYMLDEFENANRATGPDPRITNDGAGLTAIAAALVSEIFARPTQDCTKLGSQAQTQSDT